MRAAGLRGWEIQNFLRAQSGTKCSRCTAHFTNCSCAMQICLQANSDLSAYQFGLIYMTMLFCSQVPFPVDDVVVRPVDNVVVV
jgi:hypothetical protein